jgi:hypothetical protein
VIGGVEGGADETRFRARTGTLTLLFAGGSTNREGLLELLEAALAGGRLDSSPGALDEGELGECEDEYEEEDDDDYDENDEEEGDYDDDGELEEGERLLDTLPPVLLESQGLLDPHAGVRATERGVEFLFVAAALERWLRRCPEGALEPGPGASAAIASLVCCWSATVTHALAGQPLTLPELHRAVGILDYETAEEHVAAMERTGQVALQPAGGETRYALTDWMREGISPIIAAARYECHYPEQDVAPPDVLDVAAPFQLSLPLLLLPPDLRGSCRLGVRIPHETRLMAGATAEVDRGRVLASSPLLEREPENWATGSPLDWMDTVVDPAAAGVELGGDEQLAVALLVSLHETLFGAPL